ncbi:MAG: hypothetical protein JWN64_242 [Parcubacteria group bacterium]|nr:hypothetical protein [Parcubacteria group bacterium]
MVSIEQIDLDFCPNLNILRTLILATEAAQKHLHGSEPFLIAENGSISDIESFQITLLLNPIEPGFVSFRSQLEAVYLAHEKCTLSVSDIETLNSRAESAVLTTMDMISNPLNHTQ